MTRLEDLQPTVVRGILPGQIVTVVGVQWFGSAALELTYKGPCRVANVTADDTGLLVRPEIASQQIDRETAPPAPVVGDRGGTTSTEVGGSTASQPTPGPASPVQPAKPRRYHGTVALDSARVGRDAGRIADEVITHLVGLVGSSVRVTLEIEPEIPAGASDNVVGTVTENSRTLKFASNSGFETE